MEERIRWIGGVTKQTDKSLTEQCEVTKGREGWRKYVHGVAVWVRDTWMANINNNNNNNSWHWGYPRWSLLLEFPYRCPAEDKYLRIVLCMLKLDHYLTWASNAEKSNKLWCSCWHELHSLLLILGGVYFLSFLLPSGSDFALITSCVEQLIIKCSSIHNNVFAK